MSEQTITAVQVRLAETQKHHAWVLDQRNELLAALKLAVRYLEHPDVQRIPFALHVSAPLERARTAIEKAEGS